MSSYIIKGGSRLEGIVKISGSKNASLPIIAATILNKGITTLYNVPNIQDTQMMYEIIKLLGGKVQKKKNKVIINTTNINKYEIPDELMHKMRSSVILVGAIVGRYKTVRASKNFGFIEIKDGSFFKNVQVVFNNDLSNFNEISKLTISSSIKVTGNVIITENAKQPFEIHANNIEIFNFFGLIISIISFCIFISHPASSYFAISGV